jgi:hypothetical protein
LVFKQLFTFFKARCLKLITSVKKSYRTDSAAKS